MRRDRIPEVLMPPCHVVPRRQAARRLVACGLAALVASLPCARARAMEDDTSVPRAPAGPAPAAVASPRTVAVPAPAVAAPPSIDDAAPAPLALRVVGGTGLAGNVVLFRVDQRLVYTAGSGQWVNGHAAAVDGGPVLQENWSPVCTAPCDQPVARGVTYRVAGDGVLPSAPFALNPQTKVLNVHAASQATPRLGRGVLVVGALSLLTSIALFRNADSDDPHRVGAGVGAAFLGMGLLSLMVAMPLLMRTASTVEQIRSS